MEYDEVSQLFDIWQNTSYSIILAYEDGVFGVNITSDLACKLGTDKGESEDIDL